MSNERREVQSIRCNTREFPAIQPFSILTWENHMKFLKIAMIASIATLLSGLALAATVVLVKDLPASGEVMLQGTVESFDGKGSFVLRDSSGAIKINMGAIKAANLKNGEKVGVTGTVYKGPSETDIAALSVNEDKPVGANVGKSADIVTTQNPASSAKAVDIGALPESGLVKIHGTVASVKSEKRFTLQDLTGVVDVLLTSGQSAFLKKGAEVTVVGSVDSGLIDKRVTAVDVVVLPVVEEK